MYDTLSCMVNVSKYTMDPTAKKKSKSIQHRKFDGIHL